MSIRSRIVSLLLRAYPPEWRIEYGPELADILLRRSVGLRDAGDVLWNGVRQRVRLAEPATLCGMAAMLVISIGLGLNIAGLPTFGHRLPAFLQDSRQTFPTVVVTPPNTELYVLWLVVCGCWTTLRHGGRSSRAGLAGMQVTALAGTPIIIAAILMLFGILDIAVLHPGDMPTSFHEHGFTYTYYSGQQHSPSPLGVLVATLSKLPESWLWGVVGGRFGRSILRSRATRTVS
jgi:hypothetical protein